MAAKKKTASKKKLRRPEKPAAAPTTKPKPVGGKKGRKAQGIRRDLPVPVPAAQALGKQISALRNIAATDFITDPDSHTVEWHWRRKDRPFQTAVTFVTFENWAKQDKWRPRRIAYWKGIEERVRDQMADEFIRRRINDLQSLERRMESLGKYLDPLLDEEGNPKLDEKTKLPLYPLDLPKLDRFIEAYLKLHERVLLLRGEATKRTEMTSASPGEDEEESDLSKHLRPSAPRMRPKLSRGDARALARHLVRQRAPALAEAEVIDASYSSDDNQEVHQGEVVGGDDRTSD